MLFKTKVGALEPRFSTNEQQDSHEFLTLLMDWLHEDLKEVRKNCYGIIFCEVQLIFGKILKFSKSQKFTSMEAISLC